MKLKSSILLAFRMILPKTTATSNARRSMLGAMLCVGLSLIPLVVVLVVSDGMIEGITDRLVGLSSYHIQALQYSIYTDAGNKSEMEYFTEEIRKVDGVKSAYPERQGIALAAGSKGRTGATIRAVDPEIFVNDTAFKKYVEVRSGSTDLSDRKSALIGTKMAEILQLKVGDKIRLITAREGISGKLVPKVSIFNVTGIISCGYQELDALWVFVPFSSGYDIMSKGSSKVIIGIETFNPFSVEFQDVCQRIVDIRSDEFEIYKWNELNTSEFENFSSTKMLLLLIMFLIVLVASINISSAVVMLVMERRREIAILKSIGASSNGITVAFVVIGTCIGVGGIITGIPIGLLCAVNINGIIAGLEKVINFFSQLFYMVMHKDGYTSIHLLDPAFYLESIPVNVPYAELLMIVVITLVLAILVSIIPSVRAGKEKPLAILRKV